MRVCCRFLRWLLLPLLALAAPALSQTIPATTWILPAAARVGGAAGSFWTTVLTLANSGTSDALVTLKFLGHDTDGRNGDERALLVSAGTLVEYPGVLGTLFGRVQDYGAIRVTSSSANLVVQSETSTPSLGGTVGQAVPVFGAADFAGATPRVLVPIRENASFRTNLVLANASEIPVIAHLELSDWGNFLGARDVVLPPLGMTQINRVVSFLGATTLEAGRISVSTPTSGGLIAAYASVIDNTTNDPRTILPQDAHEDPPGPNLLSNPGFDHDLSGWNASHGAVGYGDAGATWSEMDRKGVAASGSAALGASASAPPGAGSAVVSQCVGVVAGRTYNLRAWVMTGGWSFFGGIPSPQLRLGYFGTTNCSGSESASSTSIVRPFNGLWGSDVLWFVLFAPGSIAPSGARSALVALGVGASAGVHGLGISATFDDVFFGEGAPPAVAFLQSAASVNGIGGSYWTTDLSLSKTGSEEASIYLEFFGNGTGGGSFVANVSPGETETVRDVLATLFQRSLSWGPMRITATSPGISISAETSTPDRRGGTLGQALAAVATRDLIGATPKCIAPVRDDAFFRTNLVVSNATESPLIAHIELFDAAGVLVGSRDMPLDPLAAAQIGGVGWALAGGAVNPGRIAVSTTTPGGLVAAYASVIDNVTNDPRTLLPR